MNGSRELFRNLRARTLMYLPTETYDAVAGYVAGFDGAMEGGALKGFQPWLALKLKRGFNIGWPELVLCVAFSEVRSPTTAADHRHAIDTLFDLIDEFDAACPSYYDVVAVFAKYHARIEIKQARPTKKRRQPSSRR